MNKNNTKSIKNTQINKIQHGKQQKQHKINKTTLKNNKQNQVKST